MPVSGPVCVARLAVASLGPSDSALHSPAVVASVAYESLSFVPTLVRSSHSCELSFPAPPRCTARPGHAAAVDAVAATIVQRDHTSLPHSCVACSSRCRCSLLATLHAVTAAVFVLSLSLIRPFFIDTCRVASHGPPRVNCHTSIQSRYRYILRLPVLSDGAASQTACDGRECCTDARFERWYTDLASTAVQSTSTVRVNAIHSPHSLPPAAVVRAVAATLPPLVSPGCASTAAIACDAARATWPD